MPRPIKLLQFTDTHLYSREDAALRGVATYPALERTLQAARSDIEWADALLVTGDIVQDDPGGYALFRRLFAPLGKPVYCIPGNHDEVPAMRAALEAAPFQIGGSFAAGSWRVVLLDSSVPGRAQGELSADALVQLDRALAAAPGAHTLVCLHHHPVAMQSRWLDAVALVNPQELFAILDRHPQVRAVAWGHVHQTFEGTRGAMRLFATPSTCAQFLPYSNNFALDPQPPGYRRFTLHDDGSIETSVARLEQPQARTATSQNSLRA